MVATQFVFLTLPIAAGSATGQVRMRQENG
jgi:hypothetical protein